MLPIFDCRSALSTRNISLLRTLVHDFLGNALVRSGLLRGLIECDSVPLNGCRSFIAERQ